MVMGTEDPARRSLTERWAELLEPGSLLEATPECLVVAAADGAILYANHRVEELTGFMRQELVGKPVELLVAIDLQEPDAGARTESFCRRADGGQVPVEVHLGTIEGPERLLVVTLRDVSELRAGREARFEAEAKYRTLVEQIPAVVYLDPVDANQDSIYVSPQVVQLLGVSQDEWLADPYCWRKHVHPEDIDRVWEEYAEAYREHTTLDHEYRMVHEDGTVKWVMEQAYPIRDERGDPWLLQGVIFDISERKRAEEEIAFLAYHDKLTGLPNRVLFEEMLAAAITRARRHDLGVSVVFLDLDNFKLLNDSLGHQAGDAMLVQLAERLRGCTRETDLVARQGGDEFLLLLADLERAPNPSMPGVDMAIFVAESVAERVHEVLKEPFEVQGTEFIATGSVGISLFPTDAIDADTLLKNADAAMYQSKRHEPGGSVVFANHAEDSLQKLSTTTRLRRAVEEQNWVLHYQPIVSLRDGSCEGVEALVRWRDPVRELGQPNDFIPLAEELGLIEAIGDWVLEEVTRQQAAWAAEGLDLRIGFNISPRQLWSANLAEKILGKLRTAGVDPDRVAVEITESSAMADPDRTQQILGRLRALGLTIAIDDFGTGYSSLARLKHLPVNVLKIDRTFIRDVHRDTGLASMVNAMIQLADGLGMTSVAEGIESHAELAFLQAHKCQSGQGFLFSRPVTADEIPELALRPGGLIPARPTES
jgi:diguanylate cyclase (GGDEF)-like protein/PAS domain S-box-containing protein